MLFTYGKADVISLFFIVDIIVDFIMILQ